MHGSEAQVLALGVEPAARTAPYPAALPPAIPPLRSGAGPGLLASEKGHPGTNRSATPLLQ